MQKADAFQHPLMSCYASIVIYVIIVIITFYLDGAYAAPAPVRAVYGLHNSIVHGDGQEQYPARVPKTPYAAHAQKGYDHQYGIGEGAKETMPAAAGEPADY